MGMSDIDTMIDDSNTDNQIDNSVDDAVIQDIISNIELLIDNYKSIKGIESLVDITQQQFTGLLDYIRFNYFIPNKHILYKYIRGISNNNHISHQYNYYVLSHIANYYIYMCRDNNKVSNIYGFSQLTGIADSVICHWGREESQNPEAYRLSKNLSSSYENSLENGAQSGRNPVGFIATLNHRFGWSADNKPQLTVNITRSKNEILSSINPELLTDNL